MRLTHWKLSILAYLMISLFFGLGCWQLSRAKQKQALLNIFTNRTQQYPLTIVDLNQMNTADWRFYRLQLKGTFDNQHSLLLDNKVSHGKIGYEVYTPFYTKQLTTPILIDRGFIPMSQNRQLIPAIIPIHGETTVTGMLNLPPKYVALGAMNDSAMISWPLRIEFINLNNISNIMNNNFFPYVLQIDPRDPRAYPIEWKAATMPPEKHTAYAIQWFALALTLLILFVVNMRGRFF